MTKDLECDSPSLYKGENVKMDFERAYNEMVEENILLKSQIRRYEEVVQTLAIINFVQGRQNN